MNNKKIINNSFDYSNAIMTVEYVTYLVQYLDGLYNQLQGLIKEDKTKNEKLKSEYRNYRYKTSFSDRFRIYISLKGYNNITCEDLETFKAAIKDGNLKNVSFLEIKLELNYKTGKENELIDLDNEFIISLKPYEIVFNRKSNNNDVKMNQIENNINEILKKIPTANTIFCTKD